VGVLRDSVSEFQKFFLFIPIDDSVFSDDIPEDNRKVAITYVEDLIDDRMKIEC
jgi:hypothetical protein